MRDETLDRALQRIEEAKEELEDWNPSGEMIDRVLLWRQAVMHLDEAHWFLNRTCVWPRDLEPHSP